METRTARYAWLTVGVACVTLLVKSWAAYLTGSVGLFSDALESTINLATSLMLVIILRIAKAPPDSDHPYGHDKAEYFANGVQGTLILIAAVGIIVAATERFLQPRLLEAEVVGLSLAALAGIMNLLTALYLKRKARELRSTALRGEAAHLLSDVWTSAAVIVGLGLVYGTEIAWLDPLAALAVSGVILSTGVQLIRTSISGLMDAALPTESHQRLVGVLETYKRNKGIDYHALRTRVAGARTFVSVHILVPGVWSVKRGHELLDEIESAIGKEVNGVTVLTHLEPLEEECSFQDMDLI